MTPNELGVYEEQAGCRRAVFVLTIDAVLYADSRTDCKDVDGTPTATNQ